MRHLTEETKFNILQDYNNRELKAKDIDKKYGLGNGISAKIAVEMGAQPRTKKYGSKNNSKTIKKCPNCKKTIEIKGARFCCFCGTDVRSSIEILIERNKHLLNIISDLPLNSRDEFRDVLLANIEALQEGGKTYGI